MPQRLTPVEAVMWRIGHDPLLRMTVGGVILLDRPPAVGDLRNRLAAMVAAAPRLRRRPVDSWWSGPAWVDDDPVEIDRHLRTVTVAAPGGHRALLDLVALVEATPLPTDRSPWDATLFDGLADGGAALYLRGHHVLTDGTGALSLIGLLLDDLRWPSMVNVAAPAEAEASNGRSASDTLGRGVALALRPLAAGLDVAVNVAPVDAFVQHAQRGLDVASSLARQAFVVGGPLSPLPERRTPLTRFETLTVEEARATALALGGSRNDLLAAAGVSGVGRYYERLGHSCSELRLATPTGRHRPLEAGGNAFVPMRMEVPTNGRHPAPHFGVVAERMAQARTEAALPLAIALTSGLSRLPARVLVSALRAQAAAVDLVVTAMRGLKGTRTICDAVVTASYPFAPRLGCPVNLSAFGNDGRLDVGVAMDAAAITDPVLLVECVAEAFADLGRAARLA